MKRLPSPRLSRLPRALAASLLAGLVTACNGGTASLSTPDLGLAPPEALMQSRAIDRTRLEPIVTLDGDTRVPMTRGEGDRWIGTVNVAPDRDYAVRVAWVETIDTGERARELELAVLERDVPVGADGARLAISSGDYDLTADLDADGVSNFGEREAGTDPFSAPDAPPDDAPDTPTPNVPTPSTPAPLTPISPEPPVPAPEPPALPDPVPPLERPPGSDSEADVIIRRVARDDAPEIDGEGVVRDANGFWIGEWAAATQRDARGDRLLIDKLMVDNGTEESDGDAYRFWGAVHDGRFLYVLVVVDDDCKRVSDSPELWNDDSLELYIDGDNSKRRSYGDDDYHHLLPLIVPGSYRTGVDDGIVHGFFSSQTPIDIRFTTGPGVGPRGLRRARCEQDVYELRVELESVGIVPERPFGFELQVNDDDDGGEREAKWGWAHPSRDGEDVDFTYRDPSYMGTAILE